MRSYGFYQADLFTLKNQSGPNGRESVGAFGLMEFRQSGLKTIYYIRASGMSTEDLCRLTGRRCYQSYYGSGPCSKAPTLNDARNCLMALGEKNRNLEDELGQADKWIESLSAEIMDGPTTNGSGD